MGKTVKSRLLVSITSFLCVVALCIWANSGIPSLYESYKERTVAQAQASASTNVQKVSKPSSSSSEPAPEQDAFVAEDTAVDEAPVEDFVSEDANVFDIDEPEEVPAEEPEEEVEEEYEEIEEEEIPEEPVEENKTFFEKVVDFITGVFETLTSGGLLQKIKDFFSNILGLVGINL